MKRINIFILNLLFIGISKLIAQDLIENGSFENLSYRPIHREDFGAVKGWFTYKGITVDILHDTVKYGEKPPQNNRGYQSPRTGKGMIHLVVTGSDLHNEYVFTRLKQSLEVGAMYKLKLYVNMANTSEFALWKFDFCFFQDSLPKINPLGYATLFGFKPLISNKRGNYIKDTLNWKLIDLEFRADASYRYMSIGHCDSNSKTDFLQMLPNQWGPNARSSYYYFDDVSLTKIRDPLKVTQNLSICNDLKDSITLIAQGSIGNFIWFNKLTGAIIGYGPTIKVLPKETTIFKVISHPQDSGLVKISVNPIPLFNLGKDITMCKNTLHIFKCPLDSNLINSYTWHDNSHSSNFVCKKDTLVTLNVTDNFGCKAKDSAKISYLPIPLIQINADTALCKGTSVQISASGGKSIEWKNFNHSTNSFKEVLMQTQYIVARSYDGKCYSDFDSLLIKVYDKPVIKIKSQDSVCLGEEIEISASGGNKIVWLSPFLKRESIQQKFKPHVSFWAKGIAFNGSCQSQPDSAFIAVDKMVPKADFSYRIDTSENKAMVIFKNNSTGANNYLWSFGDNFKLYSNNKEYSHNYNDGGKYEIQLKAISEFKCIDSITKKIIIPKNFVAYIPTGFSPNNDAINEVWEIVVRQGSTINGEIYNTYGQVIYRLNYPKEPYWDGTIKGVQVPSDTYSYLIEINNGQAKKWFNGTVTLVR